MSIEHIPTVENTTVKFPITFPGGVQRCLSQGDIIHLPNQFPECPLDNYPPNVREAITNGLHDLLQIPKDRIYFQGNTIAILLISDHWYSLTKSIPDTILTIISNHDMDPIEYRIREITQTDNPNTPEEINWCITYFTLVTINP